MSTVFQSKKLNIFCGWAALRKNFNIIKTDQCIFETVCIETNQTFASTK